jgi:hypothetical protein
MRSALFIGLSAAAAQGSFTDVTFGNDGDEGGSENYNATSNDLIPSTGSDSWQDALDAGSASNDESSDSAVTSYTGGGTLAKNESASPPSTLIYTCGGTADLLGYCQFPFTTLAGNTYTNSCADKVEDNPDYTVDRPWCFTSASEWGFCDCRAAFSFAYVTTQNALNSTIHDIRIQISVNYPGTVWCSLSSDKKSIPSLSQLNASNSTNFIGSSTYVSPDLIKADLDAIVTFSATTIFIKAHPWLACQASLPGLSNQPSPLGLILGASGSASNGGTDNPSASSVPFLVTTTSGALMYSVLIAMILGGFIGTRTALDQRRKLLRFAKLDTEEEPPVSSK